MTAKDIMTKKVKTVTPSMAVRDLAQFLVKENISGAPVVDDAGAFRGIVTEEDLIFQDKKVHIPTFISLFSSVIPLGVARMEEELHKIAGTSVESVMQASPRTITRETPIEEIATIMAEEKVYYLPVVEDSRVVGVVTKRDFIKAVAKGKIW